MILWTQRVCPAVSLGRRERCHPEPFGDGTREGRGGRAADLQPVPEEMAGGYGGGVARR